MLNDTEQKDNIVYQQTIISVQQKDTVVNGRRAKQANAKTMMKVLAVIAAVAVASVYAAASCTNVAGFIPAIAIRQEMCPASAPFFGFMGCAAALVFACKFPPTN